MTVSLVTTIKERCRVCYTCVRECPAKAIRIAGGQAEVIPGQCIGCGNCVKVCSQHAKRVASGIGDTRSMIAAGDHVAAIIAPSFPAEFVEVDPSRFIGMLRRLGFTWVHEVAFGADLVADRYHTLVQEHRDQQFVATTCPAVVEYVERYRPELIAKLAPVASPMAAAARVVRRVHGESTKVVFIGPCIAKKMEAINSASKGDVDAVLTFQELRVFFDQEGVAAEVAGDSDFDPPRAGTGALFAVSRGLLEAAEINDDLVSGTAISVDGRAHFVEAINEVAAGEVDVGLVEVLACQGCIMGPGVSNDLPLFQRRSLIGRYVRSCMEQYDEATWRAEMDRYADLDLSRTYVNNDHRLDGPAEDELATIMQRMGKYSTADELNCGACGYDTCREHAIAIYKGLAESEMCLPYTIEQLGKTVDDLAHSNQALATTQAALMQAEKLASMGQLAAGIAHEVNNPLGVVLMYAHLLLDGQKDAALQEDLTVIAEQADRCRKIVAGLLNFARQNKVMLQPADVRELVERIVRTEPTPANITVTVTSEVADPVAEVDADQLTQVIVNLLNNAVEAMPEGGSIVISIEGSDDEITLRVSDNGTGISDENLGKVFEPFFTTKQMGKGTGLGLAVSYGIVKMHRGDIRVISNSDPKKGPTGSTFSVTVPRRGQRE